MCTQIGGRPGERSAAEMRRGAGAERPRAQPRAAIPRPRSRRCRRAAGTSPRGGHCAARLASKQRSNAEHGDDRNARVSGSLAVVTAAFGGTRRDSSRGSTRSFCYPLPSKYRALLFFRNWPPPAPIFLGAGGRRIRTDRWPARPPVPGAHRRRSPARRARPDWL